MIVVALALLAPTLLRRPDAGGETTEQQYQQHDRRGHLHRQKDLKITGKSAQDGCRRYHAG